MVVSGLEAAWAVFLEAGGENLGFVAHANEGDRLAAGSVLVEVEGLARPILAAERVALNLVMCLSGIATFTVRYVEVVVGTGARITDTRKTTPGLSLLEKAAVRAGGGGTNHRAGLDDHSCGAALGRRREQAGEVRDDHGNQQREGEAGKD